VSRWFACHQSIGSNRSPKRPGRRRLFVEELESRALPSTSPVAPLSFATNLQNLKNHALFTSAGPGWQAYLERNGDAILALNTSLPETPASAPAILRLHFVGASPNVRAVGLNATNGSSDFSAHGQARRRFAQVRFQNVYRGIDVVYQQTAQNHLEFS